MTGLHTRGYRPKPGERDHFAGARDVWWEAWSEVRNGGPIAIMLGCEPDAFDDLASEALDAREQLDPLTERYAMRIARKAVAICGRIERASTPVAANPWGPS